MHSSRLTLEAPSSAQFSTPEALIEVRDVTIGWDDHILLRNASFEVRAGEIVVVLGPSGVGKSTLLRHLIGLETPIAGQITVAGEQPTCTREHPPRFGVTFQSGALFGSLTVADNVALPLREWVPFGPQVIGAIVAAKLRVVGLDDSGDKLPQELSGGMTTRAAIARALSLEPALVFLDEPWAGQDPITAVQIEDLLLTLNRALNLTMLIVSHELASIFRVATRCILLDKETQSIIAEGDPRELRDHSTDPKVRHFLNPRAES
jgi:phospholipid/cholesterol/gamma-HCH transport system ATP-binding protein